MHDRIANQVLKRSSHFFKHATVKLGRSAANIEVDALVELLRNLPRNAIQTFRHVRKRHQPHAHQLLLQVARQARLRRQIGVRALQTFQHIALDHRDVFDRFGKHPSQLLQTRIAIELERIEVRRFARQLVATRLDLSVGLDLDFPQLRAQPRNVFGQVGQRSLDRADLVFELRARDRDFACLVDQLVEDVGAHANEGRGLLRSGRCRRHRRADFATNGRKRRNNRRLLRLATRFGLAIGTRRGDIDHRRAMGLVRARC